MKEIQRIKLCRVIETQTLWGETVCRIWLPDKDIVVRLLAMRFRPVHEASVGTVDGIAYRAAAAWKVPENVLYEDSKPLMWYDQTFTRFGEDV